MSYPRPLPDELVPEFIKNPGPPRSRNAISSKTWESFSGLIGCRVRANGKEGTIRHFWMGQRYPTIFAIEVSDAEAFEAQAPDLELVIACSRCPGGYLEAEASDSGLCLKCRLSCFCAGCDRRFEGEQHYLCVQCRTSDILGQ